MKFPRTVLESALNKARDCDCPVGVVEIWSGSTSLDVALTQHQIEALRRDNIEYSLLAVVWPSGRIAD